jgi:hypothetical protein
MSLVANLSDGTANTQATAFAPLCNSGPIKIYSGPQPANANTATGGSNTLLATLTFGATAFGAPTAGVLTANTITSGTAGASGTATFARVFKSDGTTVVMDLPVGISATFALVLNTVSITMGDSVGIVSLTYTIPEVYSVVPPTQIANISDTAANAQATAFAPLCNNGSIQVFSGSQPVNANTALSGNTLLSTLRFSATAFGPPTGGVLTANPIASGTNVASGTASFARIYQSDGMTVVMDVQVGLAGGGYGIGLNTVNMVDGAALSLTSFLYSVLET